MSEAEYHRAAFGTPGGGEQAYPWGDAAPTRAHGNFDFQNWDVMSAGAYPHGHERFGVAELIGNGWEHTSTPFMPFDGFEPHASYPRYSADFFDGKHYVVKGASPVTPVAHIRRSFRNWYYGDYPYLYAKFRTVKLANFVRIVSLLPSVTEICFSLGLGEQLVGVTHECDYPPEALAKPKLTRSMLPGIANASRKTHSSRELGRDRPARACKRSSGFEPLCARQ